MTEKKRTILIDRVITEEVLSNLSDWTLAGNIDGGGLYCKGNEGFTYYPCNSCDYDDYRVYFNYGLYSKILDAFLKEIEENPQDWKLLESSPTGEDEFFIKHQIIKHKSGRTHYSSYLDCSERCVCCRDSFGSFETSRFPLNHSPFVETNITKRWKRLQKILNGEIVESKNEEELSEEEKNKFNQLKNGEITDVNKINEVVNEVSESVNKEGARNLLNKLMARAKALVEGKVEGSVDYLQRQVKEVQEGLYSFVCSTNSYQKSVYQDREDDVKLALGQLENHSFHKTNQSGQSGFFRPEVVIPLVGAVILGTIATIVLVRRKKQLKK